MKNEQKALESKSVIMIDLKKVRLDGESASRGLKSGPRNIKSALTYQK